MMRMAREVAPFLRWAGGKSWLTNFVIDITQGININHYYEPFLGGGAVFFALQPPHATLSDMNADLIDAYSTLRDQLESVIVELKRFRNDSECYYKVRAEEEGTAAYKCARFIFLNQTSFNGLYRVNNAGHYNVPFGNRKIEFIKEEHLRRVSAALQNVVFDVGDFADTLPLIREGDLCFLDPPYTVSHNHNGFIKYNQHLFSLDDQYRLRKYIDAIKKRGAYYILTNAAHDKIREIFYNDDDVMIIQKRHNTIGGTSAQRGHVEELVFTNIGVRCNYELD